MESNTESKMSSTSKSISRTSTIQKSSTISTLSSSDKKIITTGAEELLKMPTIATGGALTTPCYENERFHKQLQFQSSNNDQPDENLLSSSIAASSISTQSSTDLKKISKIDVVSDILISHSSLSMESTKQLITAASSNFTQSSTAMLKSSESLDRDHIQTSSCVEEVKKEIDN